ncbi:MAG: beta-1,6-N-acetylglucosaminyltransferase [Acidobacteriaceae bacterium]
MKIAYLIFAYKNPQLIAREIQVLSSADSAFFIHVDSKSDLRDFAAIKGDNVFFTEQRISVYWAEFSGVRAILLLIQQALESSGGYEYLVLLSGSEYPLRSRSYIERYLEANNGSEFIRMVKVPAPGKPLSAFTTLRYESGKPIRRLMCRALAKIGMAQRDYRRYLGEMEPYSGCTWWALTRSACEYIIEFSHHNPQVAKFFKDVSTPEEAFFHTILGNSQFRSRIRGNLVYEDWSARGSRPEMITEKHIAFFESQERVFDLSEGPCELLFARKFSDQNLGLLRRIDRMVAQKCDFEDPKWGTGVDAFRHHRNSDFLCIS